VFAGFGGMHGGFVPSGLAGVHQQYRYKAEGPILMVAVLEGGTNVSDLRLRLDWEMVRHLPEMHRPGRPEGWERLPPLAPPAGVPLRDGGGGGGSGSWHSEATVETATGHIVSDSPVEMKLLNGGRLSANHLEIVDNGASIQFSGGVELLLNQETQSSDLSGGSKR